MRALARRNTFAYFNWVSRSISICASSSASTVRVPRPSFSDNSWRVNLYVLNDQERMVSSFDWAVGDCGVASGERDGRTAFPDAPPDPLELWSGVDNGMLLVAIEQRSKIKITLKSWHQLTNAKWHRKYQQYTTNQELPLIQNPQTNSKTSYSYAVLGIIQ